MSMFCYQCQEAAGGKGCNKIGVCGKTDDVANLQDLLIFTLKGVSEFNQQARKAGLNTEVADHVILDGLFATITNANFDPIAISAKIEGAIATRDAIKATLEAAGKLEVKSYHESATWTGARSEFEAKSVEPQIGVLATENEDVRSLRELIVYGLKGMAAYAEHAANLGKHDKAIIEFIEKALLATINDGLSADELVALTLETGKFGVNVMALLDGAHTSAYGNPEITEVNIGVRNNPAILISGHDLKDMEELLAQTAGTGVDVYTHSEMQIGRAHV